MEKINIAELLKDCPKGMELDCVLFNNPVRYDGLDNDDNYPITILTENDDYLYLTEEGYLYNMPNSKCVIFPKGKTTWEGFVPPCQFKDGDIITCTNSACSFVAIFKEMNTDTTFRRYVSLTLDDVKQFGAKESWSDFRNPRLATEEEKQKLFQAIKDNGYKWNEETKTLEKLVEPKFKVGDRIRSIKCNLGNIYNVIEVKESLYVVNKNNGNGNYHIDFEIQDDWELVPSKFDISTLRPFESRVLVRNDMSQLWIPAFWGCKRDDGYTTTFGWSKYCVPFAGNERLLRTSDDCDEFYKTWK